MRAVYEAADGQVLDHRSVPMENNDDGISSPTGGFRHSAIAEITIVPIARTTNTSRKIETAVTSVDIGVTIGKAQRIASFLKQKAPGSAGAFFELVHIALVLSSP
jgi:flagellar biosynthesis/type III secretory pathway ATPase